MGLYVWVSGEWALGVRSSVFGLAMCLSGFLDEKPQILKPVSLFLSFRGPAGLLALPFDYLRSKVA